MKNFCPSQNQFMAEPMAIRIPSLICFILIRFHDQTLSVNSVSVELMKAIRSYLTVDSSASKISCILLYIT